jgi:hypothetical protein
MRLVSAGSGELANSYGDGCGPGTENACIFPTFQADFDPDTESQLRIRVTDETGTMELDGTITKPTVAFAREGDGGLHVGEDVALTVSPVGALNGGVEVQFVPHGGLDAGIAADASDAPDDAAADGSGDASDGEPDFSDAERPSVDASWDASDASDGGTSQDASDASTSVDADSSSDAADATVPPSPPSGFTCERDSARQECNLQVTSTGVSFVVPNVAPGPGALIVSGFASTTVDACTGVEKCELDYKATPIATMATSVSPNR